METNDIILYISKPWSNQGAVEFSPRKPMKIRFYPPFNGMEGKLNKRRSTLTAIVEGAFVAKIPRGIANSFDNKSSNETPFRVTRKNKEEDSE